MAELCGLGEEGRQTERAGLRSRVDEGDDRSVIRQQQLCVIEEVELATANRIRQR